MGKFEGIWGAGGAVSLSGCQQVRSRSNKSDRYLIKAEAIAKKTKYIIYSNFNQISEKSQ
ncbi:hypothetical protein [Kamptonema sp. UHCC 0994]|uniref:hypothetical protein n=1 Tax=Kamptonema sp. UHCC 0994 TaxID=3031329 RepID=UPI0023B98A61|nr:hypothetical protein [Kamptonema sp. UHCC 0994]MDF0553747.1 hypothetical protein [Kamptonema sp. UHCC 0994]